MTMISGNTATRRGTDEATDATDADANKTPDTWPGRVAGALRKHRLFALAVVLPTLAATVYYGLIASDIYVSEASFVVRSPQRQGGGGLGALLQSTGFSAFAKAPDDVYAVSEFMLSRDALREVDAQMRIKAAMSNPAVDVFSRFDPFGVNGSFESFYLYYQKHIDINVDATSSISTLTVRAFTARDAHALASELLEAAEQRVNELNDRGRSDLVQAASSEVRDAEQQSRQATLALAAYRNRHTVVDPERQSTLQLQQVATLQQELIAATAQLNQLRTFAPLNSQVAATQLRIKDLNTAIAALTSGVTGGSASLASKSVDYERLSLDRDFAEKRLAAGLVALAQAREDAQRQQLYLERVVEPSVPDRAMAPRRFRAIATVLGFGLMCWALLTLVVSGVREHRD